MRGNAGVFVRRRVCLHRISRNQLHHADRSTVFVCGRVSQEQGIAANRIDHDEQRINETFRLAWRRA